MSLTKRLITRTIKGLTHLLCRVHDAELIRVPMHGPLILVSNHINFLEIPVLYTHLQPRRVTTLAKAETWDNPVLGYLFDMGEGIPLRRGEADVAAVRRALGVLEAGDILAIAPEGTRSNDGQLRRGHPGVEMLARRSGAPMLPMVFYGNEQYRHNLSRLRRTDFHVVVGQPFYVDTGGAKIAGALRQTIVDEIMYQLAALLPASHRGYYANLDAATEKYLRFQPPAVSNLHPARGN
jgi:1-acyl-sn-glycerol-3-phosphate acyltransferase